MYPTIDFYSGYPASDINDTIRRKATIMLTGDYYPELNAAGGGYTATEVCMKKHIIGNEVDNSSPLMDLWSSPEHDAMLRLADVYLVYAEAILGNSASTTDADALLYFNKVRLRAGVHPFSSLNIDNILQERRIEFAFEGQYWMDLVRLSYWNPTKAVAMVNAQDRRLFTYAAGVVTVNTSTIATVLPATISAFTLQLPAVELTADPKLAEAPIHYY